jgi:hypothetical protein
LGVIGWTVTQIAQNQFLVQNFLCCCVVKAEGCCALKAEGCVTLSALKERPHAAEAKLLVAKKKGKTGKLFTIVCCRVTPASPAGEPNVPATMQGLEAWPTSTESGFQTLGLSEASNVDPFRVAQSPVQPPAHQDLMNVI